MRLIALMLFIASSAHALPWNKPTWSGELEKQIAARLADFDRASADMESRFCPNYGKLSSRGRVTAWAHLAVAIARFESGFNPRTVYRESNGVDSIGLYQLSYGDRHCPRSRRIGDLKDPIVNIRCAVAIMADYVGADRAVAAGGYVRYGAPPPKGLARYWSVLRVPDSKSKHRLAEIIALAKKAPRCKDVQSDI
jgi:hypothetical protein